jgi:hypothetical protein
VTQCGELTITQDYRLAGQVKDPNTKVAHKVGGGQDKDKLGSERGQSISPFRWGIGPDYVSNASYPAQYWSGNSSYRFVFMILNTQDSMEHMFFNLAESWAIDTLRPTVLRLRYGVSHRERNGCEEHDLASSAAWCCCSVAQ